MNPHLWWYLARASGIVAWFGGVGAVLAGLALASRIGGRQVPPAWVLAVHRHLGALTVVALGAHLGALVADSYVSFGLLDLVVPFHAGWRSGAVAWGVLAMWAIVLVEATSLLRRRLPARWWRSIHLTSYVGAVASTVHLFTAGTDASNPVLRWSAIVAVALAAGLLSFRSLTPRRPPARSAPGVGDLVAPR